MQKTFNINSTAMVALTNRLEKINSVAMPLAVRGMLNDLAFDMKQKTIPDAFENRFTIRKKNFIKVGTSVVKVANTKNISKMQSSAGLNNRGKRLEEQEEGATVQNRTYIPLPGARVGENQNRLVSKRFWLNNIKPKQNKPIFKNQELVKAAFQVGKGGVLAYNDIIFEVRTITNKPRFFMKLSPIYSYKEGRSVRLEKKPFMEPASEKTYNKADDFYTKNANYQFNRLKK